MITEQPSDQFDAHVNIWCPVSPSTVTRAAEAPAARGTVLVVRLYWSQGALHAVHQPPTRARVWHWQAPQRKIVGTLSGSRTTGPVPPFQTSRPYEADGLRQRLFDGPVKAFWGNGDADSSTRLWLPPRRQDAGSRAANPASARRCSARGGRLQYLYRLRGCWQRRPLAAGQQAC